MHPHRASFISLCFLSISFHLSFSFHSISLCFPFSFVRFQNTNYLWKTTKCKRIPTYITELSTASNYHSLNWNELEYTIKTYTKEKRRKSCIIVLSTRHRLRFTVFLWCMFERYFDRFSFSIFTFFVTFSPLIFVLLFFFHCLLLVHVSVPGYDEEMNKNALRIHGLTLRLMSMYLIRTFILSSGETEFSSSSSTSSSFYFFRRIRSIFAVSICLMYVCEYVTAVVNNRNGECNRESKTMLKWILHDSTNNVK